MNARRLLTADRGDAGLRLDLVLCRHLAGVPTATRTRIQGWIEAGRLTVNGVVVRRPAARAAAGDLLGVALPDEASRAGMAAEEHKLDILYEDGDLLALDKPAGLVVHPTHAHAAGTLMNALLWQARDWPAGQRPSLIGRLDKLTSGLVLVAKTAALHAALQRTMASAASHKDYLAVVHGQVGQARGEINLRLHRDENDRRRVVASATAGAASLTRFERLAVVPLPRPGLSLLRCRLLTGRTHQIRVHLAARGWPIVGDPVYREPRVTAIADPLESLFQSFPRQALHSWRIALTHPVTGDRLAVQAGLPADLQQLLQAARFPDLSAVVNLSGRIPTAGGDGDAYA